MASVQLALVRVASVRVDSARVDSVRFALIVFGPYCFGPNCFDPNLILLILQKVLNSLQKFNKPSVNIFLQLQLLDCKTQTTPRPCILKVNFGLIFTNFEVPLFTL